MFQNAGRKERDVSEQDLRERLVRRLTEELELSLGWNLDIYPATRDGAVNALLAELDAAGYAVVPKLLNEEQLEEVSAVYGMKAQQDVVYDDMQAAWECALAATKGETDD